MDLLITAAARPADFRVERSAPRSASATALFEPVNDHHKFAVWNPFLKLDPNVLSHRRQKLGAAAS